MYFFNESFKSDVSHCLLFVLSRFAGHKDCEGTIGLLENAVGCLHHSFAGGGQCERELESCDIETTHFFGGNVDYSVSIL